MKGSVRKKGDSWYYRIDLGNINGKRKQIERYAGSRKQDAEKLLRQVMNSMDRTGILYEPSEISLADFLNKWMDDYVRKENKENTIIAYSGIIKNHIIPAIGAHKIKTLSPIFLQKFINQKKESGYSKSTISLMLNILKKALSYAIQPYEYITQNPAKYVRMPKFESSEENAIVKVFSPDEMQRIFERFKDIHDFYIPIALAYYTGMRLGECLALTWNNIDMEDKVIKVKYTLSDKGKERNLVVPKTQNSLRDIAYEDTLYHIFKSYKKRLAENKLKYGPFYHKESNQEFVCVKESGVPMTANDMRFFNRWCKEHDMEGKSFHTLRHPYVNPTLKNIFITARGLWMCIYPKSSCLFIYKHTMKSLNP